jgi:hypothetical protein
LPQSTKGIGDLYWFWLSWLGPLVYCFQTLLNYLAFQYFDIEHTWWKLLQKRVVRFYCLENSQQSYISRSRRTIAVTCNNLISKFQLWLIFRSTLKPSDLFEKFWSTCFITFIRYAQYRNIGKPNNLKVFGNNKPKVLIRRAKISKGHLCLSFVNNYII